MIIFSILPYVAGLCGIRMKWPSGGRTPLYKYRSSCHNRILTLNFRWKQENRLHQCQQIIQHLLLHGIHRNFYLPTHVMTKINITKSAMLVLSNYLVSLKNKNYCHFQKNYFIHSISISGYLQDWGHLVHYPSVKEVHRILPLLMVLRLNYFDRQIPVCPWNDG